MHYLLEKKSNNFSNVVSKSKEIVFYDFGFAVKKARGFLLKKTRENFLSRGRDTRPKMKLKVI